MNYWQKQNYIRSLINQGITDWQDIMKRFNDELLRRKTIWWFQW